MNRLSLAHWRSLPLLTSALLFTIGISGCRTAPVALQPPLQLRRDAERKADTPATPAADATANAAGAAGRPESAGNGALMSLETATSGGFGTHGKSSTAHPAPAPKVSRPLRAKPSAVAARQPEVAPPEDAWDVVDSAPSAGEMTGSGWTSAGSPIGQSESLESIQLTGHEAAPLPAPPRLVVPRASGPVPVPATRQVGATVAASGGPSDCDDCLPALNDWQQQLQEQTDTLSSKVDLLEEELKASREALKTVNVALEASNRELSRLGNDVRYWQGEVKRIETVMEQQHEQDIKSLDALSTTLEQLIRDDYQTSQQPGIEQK